MRKNKIPKKTIDEFSRNAAIFVATVVTFLVINIACEVLKP